jgi:magnesium chelatase family protein
MISRVNSTVRLPASFLLVASANPCPCGWAGSDVRTCVCTNTLVERYRNRLSGPLLDRIDLHVNVKPVSLRDLRGMAPGEDSVAVRARIVDTRARQLARLTPHGCRTNAEMTPAITRATCILSSAAEAELTNLVERTDGLSARAIDRIIKVARTMTDLDGRDVIDRDDIVTASSFRVLDCDPKVDPRRMGISLPQLGKPAASTRSTAD